MSRKLFPSIISTKANYRMNYSFWIFYNLFLFRLRFPDFRPLPYHPIGFNVEVAFGVVGVDERDSLFESSSFLSLRDLLDFFFFLRLALLSSFEAALFSVDFLRESAHPFSSIVFPFSWLVSSSPLSSSDEDSELDDDDEEDEESEEEDEDEELEFEELPDESEEPERGFFVLCFLLRLFLGFGCLDGSQQSQ